MKNIITELRHRAWQERASASIRPSKRKTAEHEHAAIALESLASYLEREENDPDASRALPLLGEAYELFAVGNPDLSNPDSWQTRTFNLLQEHCICPRPGRFLPQPKLPTSDAQPKLPTSDGQVTAPATNDEEDEEENERAYTNYYVHCKTQWSDDWSCMCNDRCPVCNAEIEPYASTDNGGADAETIHHVGEDFIPEDHSGDVETHAWPEGITNVTELEGW